jgi:long-chain acyl-CoA synthetase
VTQTDLYTALEQVRDRLPSLRHVIIISSESDEPRAGSASAREPARGETISLPPSFFEPATEPARSDGDNLPSAVISRDDEAVIIYTSGTTGKPKGVLLTHGNLLANAEQIADWLRLTAQDRALMIMPLFHVNALMTTGMAALWAGGSAVIAPRFSASRHWQMVSEYGVTYFGSVATMLSLLNHKHPEGLPEGLDTSRLRFALCGSAPVPVEVMKQFEALFHCAVIEGYGLSESTCRSTFNPVDGRRAGSIGLPIGNEVKIFDAEDRELSTGQIGEIVLRGPNIMKAYYRNEAATREAFKSGWLHTGDLGYKDEEGFFYIVDRKSDMIIRAGENIYPREIDEVLYQHPEVKDAATVGVPDPLYGEEVKSFVVLRENARASESELIEFCRARLADFKCPRRVEIVEDIPKGPTGKLLKRELVKR